MGRRNLIAKKSWDDHYDYVAYVVDALEGDAEDGDAEVGALATKLKRLLPRCDTLATDQRATRRALNRAHGRVRRRNIAAELIVREISHDALAQVRQNREHALYKRLFPVPASAVTKLSLERALPVVRALLAQLVSADTPPDMRKAQARRLETAITQGDAALRARIDATAEISRVTARMAVWREEANAALVGVEGALQQLAGERRLPLTWVDAYFPPARSGSSRARSPEEPPATPPSPERPPTP